jgi:hypothetical protein
MNMKNFQKDFDYFDNSFVTYLRPHIGYKCLINHFSPSNVDIIDSFFICYSWMYINITICKLHEKHSMLNEVI